MKFLITGDWHATDKQPENRTDDYWQSFLSKIDFILSTAVTNKVDAILQPGDFTDSPSLSYEAFSDLTDKFKHVLNAHPIFTVWGQHDLRFRNRVNTALRALSAACDITILSQSEMPYIKDNGIAIHGSSYNEAIPAPIDGYYNILLTHRMIVEEKLWSQQEGHEWATAFIRRNKFDLIVSGDNHQAFIAQSGKRTLINCGSLMRSTIAQIDHRPSIVIFDTKKESCQFTPVPIKSSSKVFRMDKVSQEKERNKELEAFIKGLSEHKEMSLDFDAALNEYLKENRISNGIKSIIEECKYG